jgi:hypothetical protein
MRLSLVSLNAARRGAAFFIAVEARIKISLPSPNGSVDQRKSPSWHAWIGSLGHVLINLCRCPVRPDTDRLCATAANVAMGQKATLC